MNRIVLTVLGLLLLAVPANAQDMPLSEIIAPGEGWKPYSFTVPTGNQPYQVISERRQLSYRTKSGEKAVFLKRGTEAEMRLELPLEKPTGLTLIHGDGTLVVGDAASKYLWAFRVLADGTLDAGDRYYALRVRKENPVAQTTHLLADSRDRVYAATSEGIQIFDPTGRMCGVLMLPSSDPVRGMAYNQDGDQLQILIGEKGFTRRMIANQPAPKKR